MVIAALTLDYSSGAMEGNVNRIKTIKRQMYGRADITSTYREVGSYRGAAEISGIPPKTVRRVITGMRPVAATSRGPAIMRVSPSWCAAGRRRRRTRPRPSGCCRRSRYPATQRGVRWIRCHACSGPTTTRGGGISPWCRAKDIGRPNEAYRAARDARLVR